MPIVVEVGQEITDRDLPKWPQMLTTGRPISEEQAKEIIRRTDSFFCKGYDGNDHAFNRWVRETVGMPPSYQDYDRKDMPPIEDVRAMEQDFLQRWKCVDTHYVNNSWVSSAFISGPHGWCHPDGSIGFIDNVGKWPSIQSVAIDWCMIAETFPFLDIGVTLMSGEDCEVEDGDCEPVISFKIEGDTVIAVDPKTVDVHGGHPGATRGNAFDHLPKEEAWIARLNRGNGAEQGLPTQWIIEWGKKFSA